MKYPSLEQQCVIVGSAVCLLAVLALRYTSPSALCNRTLASGSTIENLRPCAIEIVGNVEEPAIYTFEHPVPVGTVIEEAGGLKENLVVSRQFAARIVQSGSRIRVDRDPARSSVTLMDPAKRFLFYVPCNINTAGIEELVLLPGIGEKTARAILSYREDNGAFTSLDALMKVPGIGQRTLSRLKDYLTL